MIDAVQESYPMISFKTKEESLLYKPVGLIAPTLIPALNKERMGKLIPKPETEVTKGNTSSELK